MHPALTSYLSVSDKRDSFNQGTTPFSPAPRGTMDLLLKKMVDGRPYLKFELVRSYIARSSILTRTHELTAYNTSLIGILWFSFEATKNIVRLVLLAVLGTQWSHGRFRFNNFSTDGFSKEVVISVDEI
jgi:hypothetical protein